MRIRTILLHFVLWYCTSGWAWTQSLDLPIDRGSVGLAQALARLPLTSRVMFITAHPDDEPGGLLTYVSRRLHAKTSLLTLTRGEGGQNLISPDLFETLGLLRTGELLAADEYYGVQQFFTRAFDFGFSRNADETLRLWNRELVLSDMVRAIRKFRPDVIVSRWKGTSQDGHGHHQACGILAQEAFRFSGDARRFPDLLRDGLVPWEAEQFYLIDTGRASAQGNGINIGQYDPVLGASFEQLGAQGYSMHRTQGNGDSFAAPGEKWVHLLQIFPEKGKSATSAAASSVPAQAGSSFSRQEGFRDHLSGTLSGLESLLMPGDPKKEWLGKELRRLETLIKEAQSRYSPAAPSDTYLPLVRGIACVRSLREGLPDVNLGSLPKDHLKFLMADKEQDFLHALESVLGLYFEALSDEAQVTRGQVFTVAASIANRSSLTLNLHLLELVADKGWTIEKMGTMPKFLKPGDLAALKFRVTVPDDAQPTQVPWRRSNRNDCMYSFSQVQAVNDPLPAPILKARLEYSLPVDPSVQEQLQDSQGKQYTSRLDAVRFTCIRPVEFREHDRLKGTHTIPLLVVPEITLEVNPALQVIPKETASQPRWIQVKLSNHARMPVHGELQLQSPRGWSVRPEHSEFNLAAEGRSAAVRFQVRSEGIAVPGRNTFQAVAHEAGKEFSQNLRLVQVFDLWTNPWYQESQSNWLVADVQSPPGLSVGYIAGAGDRVADTLSQLGFSVNLLGAEDLASGNLDQYSCIVAGIRAYDVRQDLIAFNQRLLEYVRNGGVTIVQYNTPSAWNAAQYAPYPARIASANDRVTDETAPVRILDPQHPVFHFPNRITAEDFEGWVQERGLYFIQDRDPRYRPLLSSHDPGYPELDGGLLVAEYGKGIYVLTSYSWFRQLPEGVPGAIRLFANLVSLARNRGK